MLLPGVFQEYAPISAVANTDAAGVASTPVFPVLSAWVVDGKCEGFIMRDGGHPVTYDETSVTVLVLKDGEEL